MATLIELVQKEVVVVCDGRWHWVRKRGERGREQGEHMQAVKAVTIAQRQMPKNDAAARQKRKKKQHRLLYHLCRLLGQGIWDIGLIFYYQFDISQS